jgi:hypothetical protein
MRGKLRLLTGYSFLFLILLSLFSCNWVVPLGSKSITENPGDGVGIPEYEGRKTGTFNAINTETNKGYTLNAVHLAENEYCIVYGERAAGIPLETAEAIASTFKARVYPHITEAFGDFQELLRGKDFGQYDKLTLLLMDIKDGYNAKTNPSYIAGYFYPADMYSRGTLSYSNETAVLYLDVNPGKPNNDEFFSTIAHEFQHLINFSIRMGQQGGGLNVRPQNTWIDEGLASAAEYLYGGTHVQKKIDYFNSDTENYFSGGETFFTWDGQYEDYCTIYLFFQWLRIQAGGSPEIYKDIINSEYLDYRAVTEAAKKRIDPRFADWDTLLGHWLLANHVNAPEGSLGYNAEITTRIRSVTGVSVSLAPGEGVFSYLDGTGFTPGAQSGSRIRYLGVSQNGELITREGLSSTTATGRLLTFNANTESIARSTETDTKWAQEVARVSETGYLTGKREPWQPGTLDLTRETVPAARGPYPIDIPPAFFWE